MLAALGHPLRLTLLRAVFRGQDTTAAFQTNSELAGAGKLYHHLRELQAAGWLVPGGRERSPRLRFPEVERGQQKRPPGAGASLTCVGLRPRAPDGRCSSRSWGRCGG